MGVFGSTGVLMTARTIVLVGLCICCASRIADAQEYSPSGLTGHLTAAVNGGVPHPGFTYGISYYNSVFPLNPRRSEGTQLGWGSWLIPDNQDIDTPLCPVGTHARDNWPDQSPFRHLFQTIEGGVGLWIGSKYPSSVPKFRVNAVPDCYDTQVSSTGWMFGADRSLAPDRLGLAQLSNRMLLPPDGVSFARVRATSVFGYGWIALPLIGPRDSALGAPTGGQNWTLFFHAKNFKGPVAFFVPDLWSALSAEYPAVNGKGHDARPGLVPGVAMEIGQTPVFTATADDGRRYRRVPRLTFDADLAGRAVLQQDVKLYSKQAIWNAVADWIDNGSPTAEFDPAGIFTPPLSGSGAPMTLGGDPITFGGDFYAGAIKTSTGADAFGMQWSGALERGVLPEYFREQGGTWSPIPASDVPAETGLTKQKFPGHPRGAIPPLDVSAASPWDSSRWIAGPFTATLNDSTVEYVWYRFIDQPAVARLGLDDAELLRLQSFVESLHERSGLNGLTIEPPSSGKLATLHPSQIVTPPPGLEKGYVPIVIRQYRISDSEVAALKALYSSTNGNGWTNSTNWLTGPVHTWHGVTVQNDRVVALDLFDNNLTGTLPPQLGDLTALRSVEFSLNELSGPIPGSIGRLTNLEFFSAYGNNLSGELPRIARLGKLRLFQAGSNQLSGPIPRSFGELPSLEYLFLADNQLAGEVPAEFGGLSGLRMLELNQNALTGPLPATFSRLGLVDTLRFDETGICVPANGNLEKWLASVSMLVRSGLTCAGDTVP
jgi:hypothetical protein